MSLFLDEDDRNRRHGEDCLLGRPTAEGWEWGGSVMEMEVKRTVKVKGKSELGTGMAQLGQELHLRPCRGQE